jgi:FKBP-type peptidyl-prolyl cis-trans isomerase FkpA
MASKKERFFAGFFAVLFLVTSSTVAIIYLVTQSSSNDTSSQQQSQESNVNKLQGTKLANFTPVPSIGQLQEIDTTPGTGATVKAGDTVTVDYTGAVASTGVIFQSSKDSGQPVSFPLSQVIAGWSQGIPGIKVGGTRRLLIPAALAYGASPPAGSGIPANADLVFDVTVHKDGK